MILALYLITTIIPIIFVWMLDDNSSQNMNIALSFLCLIPIAPISLILLFLFICWVFDEYPKLKPIPNSFKRKSKSKSKQKVDDLPKCDFSNFIRYHSVFTTLEKESNYLRTLWYNTNPSRPNAKFHMLKSLFDDHRKSQYYSGSLLGSLERTFILWLDNVYEVDFKNAKRYYDIKFTLKQDITQEHIKFLEELIEAAKIPYDWISNKEYRDRQDAERFEREQSNKLNHEFSEVVKSMKADLEKIYNTKEINTNEKERVKLI